MFGVQFTVHVHLVFLLSNMMLGLIFDLIYYFTYVNVLFEILSTLKQLISTKRLCMKNKNLPIFAL